MATATMTCWGLERWLNSEDKSLFDLLVVPTGMNKATLTDNILLEASHFEVQYSDPYFFREAVGKWSGKMQHTFEKWYTAMQLTYNPIHNYDRTEIHSGTDASTNTSNVNGTSSDSNTSKVSAYDSDTMRDDTSSSGSASSSTTGSSTTGTTYGHTVSTSGNIGVTSTQQMLEQEYRIAEWNIYEHITDLFMQEFCIMVY